MMELQIRWLMICHRSWMQGSNLSMQMCGAFICSTLVKYTTLQLSCVKSPNMYRSQLLGPLCTKSVSSNSKIMFLKLFYMRQIWGKYPKGRTYWIRLQITPAIQTSIKVINPHTQVHVWKKTRRMSQSTVSFNMAINIVKYILLCCIPIVLWLISSNCCCWLVIMQLTLIPCLPMRVHFLQTTQMNLIFFSLSYSTNSSCCLIPCKMYALCSACWWSVH